MDKAFSQLSLFCGTSCWATDPRLLQHTAVSVHDAIAKDLRPLSKGALADFLKASTELVKRKTDEAVSDSETAATFVIATVIFRAIASLQGRIVGTSMLSQIEKIHGLTALTVERHLATCAATLPTFCIGSHDSANAKLIASSLREFAAWSGNEANPRSAETSQTKAGRMRRASMRVLAQSISQSWASCSRLSESSCELGNQTSATDDQVQREGRTTADAMLSSTAEITGGVASLLQ